MVYDEFAQRLTAKYRMFLFAVSSQHLGNVAAGVEATPMSLRKLRESAAEFASTFYNDAMTEIQGYGSNLYLERSDAPFQVRSARVVKFISGMLLENVKQILDQARAGRKEFASIIHDGHGGMGMLIQRSAVAVDFRATDGAGRRWGAERLMYAIARDFAYQSWLDSEFDKMLDEGYVVAMAAYDNPKHEFNGLVFSLAQPIEGIPTLAQIRAAVFHPNATATVTHVPT